jgi:hypothetical protein
MRTGKVDNVPIVVIESDAVHMEYDPENGILHHQFRKHVWGSMFRDALNRGLEVLVEHGGNKWLSDDRANAALSQDDTDWAMNDWFPRVKKAGWKYWAIVLPEHVIGQMNMKRFISTYSGKGLVVQVFDNPASALQWLKKPA